METNRTLEILKTYNFAQKNHWQLMCDLSNNDYDISYFGGRAIANDNLENFLQGQEDGRFNIDEILNYLLNSYNKCIEDQNRYYDEHKCWNENYRGYINEIDLLMKIVNQEY